MRTINPNSLSTWETIAVETVQLLIEDGTPALGAYGMAAAEVAEHTDSDFIEWLTDGTRTLNEQGRVRLTERGMQALDAEVSHGETRSDLMWCDECIDVHRRDFIHFPKPCAACDEPMDIPSMQQARIRQACIEGKCQSVTA